VSKGRLSQLVAQGLPVEPDGMVDALAAAQWVLDNLRDLKAEPTRRAAQELMVQAVAWNLLAWAGAEIPPAVVLAAAEVGLTRAQAERLGDLVLLCWAVEPNQLLAENGAPELLIPRPEAWRQEINWPALFDHDGASLVAGQIEAESRAELQAEEAAAAEVETAGSA
jgi:hypothetical protein